MRRRESVDDHAADVARRRLAALSAELAAARGEHPLPLVEAPQADPDEVPVPPATGRHARRSLGVADRLTGWVGDRLPVTVRPRPHLGAVQMGVVLLVLAVGLVGAAWWLVRSSGGAEEVVPPPEVVETTPAAEGPGAGAGAEPGAAAPSAAASPADGAAGPSAGEGEIVVDVVGRVRRPGIAVLPLGSRVVDAVRAAGGLLPGIDRTTLNLARLLTDGEQVLIGVEGAAPPVPPGSSTSSAPPGSPSAGELVNINTADQATLETLPGIGPVTAAAILQWRTEHGGFTAVEELLEVSGIGDATLAELMPFVTL
jgi:competence protein ComEA